MLGLLEPGQASPEQHMTDEGVTCVTDHLVHVGHINWIGIGKRLRAKPYLRPADPKRRGLVVCWEDYSKIFADSKGSFEKEVHPVLLAQERNHQIRVYACIVTGYLPLGYEISYE